MSTVERSMDYGSTWTQLSGQFKQKRSEHCSLFLNASHLFIFGGYTGASRIGKPEIMNLDTGVSEYIEETPSQQKYMN